MCSTMKSTFAYMPGFRRNLRVLDLDFDLRGARRRVEHRRHVRDAPVELSRRETRRRRRRPSCPAVIRRRSFSTTLATSRTTPMSTTEMNGEFGRDPRAGVERALADEPADRRRDDRVREVDLQLVEPRLRLRDTAPGRDRAAPPPPDSARRCRRRSAAESAAARTGCASDRGWSAPACRSASRWRIVAAATSNDACACLTCSRISRSSTLASRWPRVTRSPSRTVTVSSRPLTLGTASTVAAPIRLPTTVMLSDMSARLTAASSTVIGRRGPPPPPKPPNPPVRRSRRHRRRGATLAAAAALAAAPGARRAGAGRRVGGACCFE